MATTIDIYKDEEQISKVKGDIFKFVTNSLTMYDMNGKLIADFNSKPFFKDFDIRILEECEMDENTVIMIFCSYYSDQAADSKASSSSKKSGS